MLGQDISARNPSDLPLNSGPQISVGSLFLAVALLVIRSCILNRVCSRGALENPSILPKSFNIFVHGSTYSLAQESRAKLLPARREIIKFELRTAVPSLLRFHFVRYISHFKKTLLAPFSSTFCLISSTHSSALIRPKGILSVNGPMDLSVECVPEASSSFRCKSAMKRTAVLRETWMTLTSLIMSSSGFLYIIQIPYRDQRNRCRSISELAFVR